MAQPADPLDALLRSLLEHHGAGLHPRELAEILWLAPDLPSRQPAVVRSKASGPPSTREQGRRDERERIDPDPAPPLVVSALPPAEGDPLRFSLPGFFPAAPAQATKAPAAAALLPDQVLPTEADLRAVLPLRLQDARLISEPRPLQKALQPLAALEPLATDDHPRRVLDEVATVESWARTRRLWPRYMLPREPRLSLVLVVDGGLSMQVWQRLAEELRASLCQSAAFRDVRVMALDPVRPATLLGALAGAAEEQVVLVLTDCSGRHWWQGGEPQKLLALLSRRGPVAILQVLPDWMWRRTALGIGSIVAVRNRQPLAPNRPYQRLALHRGDPPPPQGDDHFVLPLLTLDPDSLAGWCALVLGQGNQSHTAACLPAVWPTVEITPGEAADNEAEEERARRRLATFFQRCSGPAEQLLRVMAAAPVLTLPVMRLLREAMVPEGGPLAMAELLLSGLIQRLDHGAPLATSTLLRRRQVDRIQFAFAPGVGSELRKTLTVPQTAEVVQRVSQLIAHRWDQCDDIPPFQAFLLDPSQLGEGQPFASLAPFATVIAEIIERLPGPAYQQLAQRLRQGAMGEPPDPFPFAFEEIVVESAALQLLPQEEANAAFSTARFEDLSLQMCSFETGRFKQGQWVKETQTYRWFPEPLRLDYSTSLDDAVLHMVHMPAGHFQMGSPPEEPDRFANEGPQHEVHLREFFLAQTPITQAQWRAVAQWERQGHEEAELWPEDLDPDPLAKLSDPDRFRGNERPVVNVSWREAMAFCQRLRLRTGKNYTLPSEAQWEYACRAGTTTPFHFGATISTELANYDGRQAYGDGPVGEYRGRTTDVVNFPANAWGLHDMHGNMWEWCADHWHANYEGAPEDDRPWLEENAPEWKERLLRGGSWGRDPRGCRSAYRDWDRPDFRYNDCGFRVCCLPQDLILYP